EYPRVQQPVWPDEDRRRQVFDDLRSAPPLVFAGEVDVLRDRVAAAARGEAFLLAGGDCAETFADSTADRIRNKIRTTLQMSAVLTYGASLPVVKMGRMAGRFAQPRSADEETRDGQTLPPDRGDAVTEFDFTPEARSPGPARLRRPDTTRAPPLHL